MRNFFQVNKVHCFVENNLYLNFKIIQIQTISYKNSDYYDTIKIGNPCQRTFLRAKLHIVYTVTKLLMYEITGIKSSHSQDEKIVRKTTCVLLNRAHHTSRTDLWASTEERCGGVRYCVVVNLFVAPSNTQQQGGLRRQYTGACVCV